MAYAKRHDGRTPEMDLKGPAAEIPQHVRSLIDQGVKCWQNSLGQWVREQRPGEQGPQGIFPSGVAASVEAGTNVDARGRHVMRHPKTIARSADVEDKGY